MSQTGCIHLESNRVQSWNRPAIARIAGQSNAHPGIRRVMAFARMLILAAGLLPCGCQATKPQAGKQDEIIDLTFRDTFDMREPSDAWTFRTPELWRIAMEQDKRILQMAEPPQRPMMPGVRRPQEYAVYNRHEFRSFSLSCWLRLDRDVKTKARDACIIFGRQDDTHLYYAHLSSLSEEFHTALVRVDGTTRQNLIPEQRRPPAPITDRQWHKVDVLRDVNAGTITVYVDEKEPPLFKVTDRMYEWGQIAIGSFDDHASFAGVLIKGQARTPKAAVAPASAPVHPED